MCKMLQKHEIQCLVLSEYLKGKVVHAVETPLGYVQTSLAEGLGKKHEVLRKKLNLP